MPISQYRFQSPRLGFRNWLSEDLGRMAAINADPAVMEFFPSLQSTEQTAAFIERMQDQFREKGFCYFAADRLDTGAFIGFIGLSVKTFEAAFTPCVDIGWRLGREHWNKGFATEGALRCMEYGFNELGLQQIVSMAPVCNVRSIGIMQKIGMAEVLHFRHPLLHGDDRLEHCVLYERKN